jgi:1,4-dihydroxy-6-naphthoate synthase
LAKITIRLGHSPDPDDAFMFYGIASGKVTSDKIEVVHVIEDIESLNRRALKGELEMTAISAHAYIYVQDAYRILSCGASMGDGYGPIVVARQKWTSLAGRQIAVPGKMTTAFLLLSLYAEDFEPVAARFDEIMDLVSEGRVDAGLLIHEGQLTYMERGLVKVLDLGEMWAEETRLPLPLGLNAVRRDLGEDLQKEVLRLHRDSIEYGLAHRDEALTYALQFGRGLSTRLGEKFVLMYVNERTRDLGEEGIRGLEALYDKALRKGILRFPARLDVLCG